MMSGFAISRKSRTDSHQSSEFAGSFESRRKRCSVGAARPELAAGVIPRVKAGTAVGAGRAVAGAVTGAGGEGRASRKCPSCRKPTPLPPAHERSPAGELRC